MLAPQLVFLERQTSNCHANRQCVTLLPGCNPRITDLVGTCAQVALEAWELLIQDDGCDLLLHPIEVRVLLGSELRQIVAFHLLQFTYYILTPFVVLVRPVPD